MNKLLARTMLAAACALSFSACTGPIRAAPQLPQGHVYMGQPTGYSSTLVKVTDGDVTCYIYDDYQSGGISCIKE